MIHIVIIIPVIVTLDFPQRQVAASTRSALTLQKGLHLCLQAHASAIQNI